MLTQWLSSLLVEVFCCSIFSEDSQEDFLETLEIYDSLGELFGSLGVWNVDCGGWLSYFDDN